MSNSIRDFSEGALKNLGFFTHGSEACLTLVFPLFRPFCKSTLLKMKKSRVWTFDGSRHSNVYSHLSRGTTGQVKRGFPKKTVIRKIYTCILILSHCIKFLITTSYNFSSRWCPWNQRKQFTVAWTQPYMLYFRHFCRPRRFFPKQAAKCEVWRGMGRLSRTSTARRPKTE